MAAGTTAGAAASADDAMSTDAAIAISIMSAIDGCDRQKFDVRNREERTPLNLEIDRYDVFANPTGELDDGDVTRGGLVRVERRAIRERDRQPRVVRSRGADDIGANLQRDHTVQRMERGQALAVLRARRGVHVRLVLEAHEVQQHYSSSPSMSSSATSTTTLWMSMRNHSRKVARSRVSGQLASFSVQAES